MPMQDVVCVGQPAIRQPGLWAGACSWLAGAVRVGENAVTGLTDVVKAVEALPKGMLVDGLFLLDHGSASTVWVGDEDIGGATLRDSPAYAPLLRRLRPYMSGEGFIYVMNCKAGLHETMLKTIAKEAGACTYGGTSLYNATFGVNTGDYRMAYPDGTLITASRPRGWGRGG